MNDHLGTPQQLLNGETGAVAWQAAYLPFGEAQVQVSVVTNNLRFPGQYYDAETELHYNWNRYYDPKSGRYILVDKDMLEYELNLYIYTNNDPINWLDENGNARRNSIEAKIEDALRRGDISELETILSVSENPADKLAARSAIEHIARLRSKAGDLLAKECKASTREQFPSELLDETLEEIMKRAKTGKGEIKRRARTAIKLLSREEYKKGAKR